MIIGYILTALGCFGTAFSFITISNDHRYTYRAPFSDHEKAMMAMLIISFIVLVVGIITIIFSVIKSKNEAKLKQITNVHGDLSVKNKCPKCGLNLSDNCTTCPQCGQKIK